MRDKVLVMWTVEITVLTAYTTLTLSLLTTMAIASG